ncbi:MAG: lipoyl synthase, partial [Flavobacteriales bacterium]
AAFITPEKFAQYKEYALGRGFRYVESGTLVRSSYHAEKHLL